MSTMKAVQYRSFGPSSVLELVDVPLPVPGPDEMLVRVAACGVNFKDIYERTGLYRIPLPAIPGSEAAGTVVQVGAGVTRFKPGDRVASAAAKGAYAEHSLLREPQSVHVPYGVELDVAAAVLLQGLTAHYLTASTFPLRSGHRCLVHAAAGGVGLLLIQLAKRRGAFVIGTVSSTAKAALAKEAGADATIIYTEEDFTSRARELTGGIGVDVVYDSVGATTFEGSIRALRTRGMLVSFGQSSGAVPPIDPLLLSKSGSLFLTRPTLGHYTASYEELEERTSELFGLIGAGALVVRTDRRFRLQDAAAAQDLLESRRSTGKVLIEVDAGESTLRG